MIVNPAAGGGRCGRAWPALARRLRDAGVDFTVAMTERPGDGTRLARTAVLEGAVTVVAVGGDGTASEVINGFLHDDRPLNPSARAALLPAGTGNDLARDFGLRGGAALTALGPHGRTMFVDVVRARFTMAGGQRQQRYALQHAAMGLMGEAVAVEFGSWVKRLARGLVYAAAGAVAILRHRARDATYRHDAGAAVAGRLHGIVVANTAHFGGGMLVAPAARVDDGMMDVIVLREAGLPTLFLRLLPAVYSGRHLGHPAVSHLRAGRVWVEGAEGLTVAIDGEMAGSTPAEFALLPGVLPLATAPGGLPYGTPPTPRG
jgi:YegS/Rv2252/BmrU family lipid kinase